LDISGLFFYYLAPKSQLTLQKFKRWGCSLSSIKSLILGCILVGVFLTGAASLGVAWYYNSKEFSNGLVQKARTVHLRLSEVAKFVAGQGGLTRIISEYTEQYKSSDQLTAEDKIVILNQVPVYASMEIGNRNAEKDQYSFRVFSSHPRNKKNEATSEELAIFNEFEKEPDLDEVIRETDELVTVYKPVRLSKAQGCLTCHGDQATSPWGNGKDILGYPMENWTDGRLHGVFAVIQNKNQAMAAQAALGKANSNLVMGFLILLAGIVSFGIGFLLVNPRINKLKNVFLSLTKQLQELTASQDHLSKSSSSLSSSSHQQAAATEEVASALEEVRSMVERNTESANAAAQSILGGAEKTRQIEELANSMSEKIEELGGGLSEVLNQLQAGNQQMEEIEGMIKNISNQTQIVNDIAFQTKILSFNASVEAARAGDHGKGFAVVAQQVGELAALSSRASSQITELLTSSTSKVEKTRQQWSAQAIDIESAISHRVQDGLEATKAAVEEISNLNELVNVISSNVIQISKASEEQAQGVSEINKAISEISSTTQLNASTASQVDQESVNIRKAVNSLEGLGEDLSSIIAG